MDCRPALVFTAALCASCGVFAPSEGDLRNDPHGHLVWAARTGDAAAIRTLAASGIDLDESSATARQFVFPDLDHIDWTALQHAVQKDQVESVRTLLEWGADPDATPSNVTPLFIAAGSTDPTMMRLLLDAGADIDKTRKALTQAEPGGPLWHLVEHAVERMSGRPSPKDVLARMLATPARSQP